MVASNAKIKLEPTEDCQGYSNAAFAQFLDLQDEVPDLDADKDDEVSYESDDDLAYQDDSLEDEDYIETKKDKQKTATRKPKSGKKII